MQILESNEKPSILTLENVADYLRVHLSTIYRLLKRNKSRYLILDTTGASIENRSTAGVLTPSASYKRLGAGK